MTRKPSLASALILACSSAAWGVDDKEDSIEGTWSDHRLADGAR
jgi:hypothetical protein